MARLLAMAVLAVRRMAANKKLLASVALGALISAAVLSATAIYADAIRDLGLQHALKQPAPAVVDVRVNREVATARQNTYRDVANRVQAAVSEAFAGHLGGVVRQGTSRTMYLTPVGAAPRLDDPARPRAVFRFRDELQSRLTVSAGAFPADASAAAIPVLLSAEFAQRNRIEVGAQFQLHAWWDASMPPVLVQVAGLGTATDPRDRYWSAERGVLDEPPGTWETFVFLVSEQQFFTLLTARIPTAGATYEEQYRLDAASVSAQDAAAIATDVEALNRVVGGIERNARAESGLPGVLRSFDERLFFVRIPLFVLLLQIAGIVAYYLVMVSTMLVERQAPEMAVLRSRGASTSQLLAQFGIEGALIAAAAGAAGPFLAAAVISALGPTPPFAALSGGRPLPVHLSTNAYAFAAVGALIAFASFMLPAWRATRATVVEFRRSTARPKPVPLLLRYYVDVALVIVLAVLFWRLRQDEQLFTRTLFGDRSADPLLLATPAVLMVTVGVVFLRLFPILLRFIAWLVGRVAGASAITVMRSLARDPTHYSRLVLMLMLATGVGMFGATFSATLEQSYADRARYPVGADLRAADLRALNDAGDNAFIRAMSEVPATRRSLAVRTEGAVLVEGRQSASVQLLGLDPVTFGDVAYYRDDFGLPLHEMLVTLAENRVQPAVVTLPQDAKTLGIWVKFVDIRGPVSVVASFRDADGRLVRITLASAVPNDAATRGWRFFALNLDQLRAPPRAPSGAQPPGFKLPLSVQSVHLSTGSAITAQRGVVLLGPLVTSAVAISASIEGSPFPIDSPRNAVELVDPRFSVIQGQRQAPNNDTVRPDTDAPPGATQAARYEWSNSRIAPRERGLGLTSDGRPVVLYLERGIADDAGLLPGSRFQLLVGGVYLDAELAGTFDYFPTHDRNATPAGFAVADASRLIVATNASLPSRPLALNEVWLSTRDIEASKAALGKLDPQRMLDAAAERARAEKDPLIAAGWAGILAISFATVLMLSAIGFVLYSYLTAQRRALEFAILRTLGFSRLQVFFAVAMEYAVIVATGMGLGTVVGLQVGRRMMDVLGVSESGAVVVPPFALAVSWTSVLVVWAVLGIAFAQTIGAVVLLYLRLAIHRALRVGEG